MIRLEKISESNLPEVLSLQVSEAQKEFVAPNSVSLGEAYIAVTSHGHAFPFGIYEDKTPVGFCMIGYGTDDAWTDAPAIARDSYNIWRLMIDRRFQGRGYGRAAMERILAFIRTYPCGPAAFCWLSYEPENLAAKRLYASFGFRETGEWDGNEVIAALNLSTPQDGIRPVTAADHDFWFSLDRHLNEEEFIRKVRDHMGYVLTLDGRPSGILRWSLFWDSIPFCSLLYVRNDCQHMGHGRRLTAYWEADMRSRGYDLVMTSTQSGGNLDTGTAAGWHCRFPGMSSRWNSSWEKRWRELYESTDPQLQSRPDRSSPGHCRNHGTAAFRAPCSPKRVHR